jgi:YD repeat-containing protein
MAFIPERDNWYLATMLFSTQIKDTRQIDLEISFTLVHAASPEEAYDAAMKIGREREVSYTNTDNQTVTVKYHGLEDLNVILDPLENGAEIAFEVTPDIKSDDISKRISKKEDLGVFRPMNFDEMLSRHSPPD